jgi:hypothetical protein
MSEKSKINYFKKVLTLLQQLHKDYPNQTLATHLSTALQDYGNTWGLSDKELSFAIEKYQLELEINNFVPDKDLAKIIEEGMHLDKIDLYNDQEEDEEDDYGRF